MSEIVYLTKYQAKKLFGCKSSVLLQITSKNLSKFENEECVEFKFTPDEKQRDCLDSLKINGEGVRIPFTKENVQSGGFLPIPLIAAGVGALASVVGNIVNSVTNHNKAKDEISELKNHYKNIEKVYASSTNKSVPSFVDEPLVDIGGACSPSNKWRNMLAKGQHGEGERSSSDAPFDKGQIGGGASLPRSAIGAIGGSSEENKGWADCRRKVEYVPVYTINDLIQRLSFIEAQEKAGNKNAFESEKSSVKKFLSESILKLSETKHLLRVATSIPISQDGEGLLNKLIDMLPFEMHVPGYKYLGPGTFFDTKHIKNVDGINSLDCAAKEHDFSYHNFKDDENRKKADKKLEYRAWDIAKNKDCGFGERAAAWLTTNAMKIKSGSGVYNYEDRLDARYQNGGNLLSSVVDPW